MADGIADCCCSCAATNVSGALGFNGIHAHGPEAMHSAEEWEEQYAVGEQVAQSTANVFDLLAPIGKSWADGVPVLCRRPAQPKHRVVPIRFCAARTLNVMGSSWATLSLRYSL